MNKCVAAGRCLVVDASTSRLQVGIWENNRWLTYVSDAAGPLESLFGKIQQILQKTNLSLHDFQGLLFCKGPGSLLGIRMTALAMQAWQLLYKESHCVIASYSSLDLATYIVAQKINYPFCVWTEATQNECLWVAPSGCGNYPAPVRCPLVEFKNKASAWHLIQRPGFNRSQENLVVDYSLDQYPEFVSNIPLIHLSKGEDCIGLTSSGGF